jgi:hypothetical protein
MIEVKMDCGCRDCLTNSKQLDSGGFPITMSRMVLCKICGNKRCPHATSHLNACTGSNDVGQLENSNFDIDQSTGKPIFMVEDDENDGQFTILKKLNESPERLVVCGALSEDHFVSTWLDIHTDLEVGEAGESVVAITPLYIDTKLDPVVLGSSGQGHTADFMMIHELHIGRALALDLYQEHALIPRVQALAYLASKRDAAAKASIVQWVESSEHGWYANGQPVLAWHQEFLTQRK